jgi:GNAT superfamily N-acetyltransferase
MRHSLQCLCESSPVSRDSSVPLRMVVVIEIRPARVEDAGALAGLTTQLGYPVAVEAMRRRLMSVLGPAHSVVLVSCNEHDQPVGWIHVAERQLLEADMYCEIMGLVVDTDHRREGRAARLVAAAEQWAMERGHRQLTVGSNIVRPESHPFYERGGFARVKTQHVYRKALTPPGSASNSDRP